MTDISLIVRTADQTRKSEVTLDSAYTGADIIRASIENWALPADTDYALVCTTSGKTIPATATLEAQGIRTGDVLEVQPVLVAG